MSAKIWPWVLGGAAVIGVGVVIVKMMPGESSGGVIGGGPFPGNSLTVKSRTAPNDRAGYDRALWPDVASVQRAFDGGINGSLNMGKIEVIPIGSTGSDAVVAQFQSLWNMIVNAIGTGDLSADILPLDKQALFVPSGSDFTSVLLVPHGRIDPSTLNAIEIALTASPPTAHPARSSR